MDFVIMNYRNGADVEERLDLAAFLDAQTLYAYLPVDRY